MIPLMRGKRNEGMVSKKEKGRLDQNEDPKGRSERYEGF